MEEKIKREDVKEFYSITYDKGVMVIEKGDNDKLLEPSDLWGPTPIIMINPNININSSGLLTISGIELPYSSVWTYGGNGYSRLDISFSDLNEGWENTIFYTEKDIILKDHKVTNWWGVRKLVEKNGKHLKRGYYLNTSGEHNIYTTTNYRLIGYNGKVEKGLING